MLLVLDAVTIKVTRYYVQMQGRQGGLGMISEEHPMSTTLVIIPIGHGRSNSLAGGMKFAQVIQMLGRNEVTNAVDIAQWRVGPGDEEQMVACLVIFVVKTYGRGG